jgi:hypothetical protein
MSSLSSGNALLASDKLDKSIKPKDATSEKSSLTAFDPPDDKSAATISKKGPMPPTAAVRSMFGVRAKKVAIKKEVLQSAAEAIVICIE